MLLTRLLRLHWTLFGHDTSQFLLLCALSLKPLVWIVLLSGRTLPQNLSATKTVINSSRGQRKTTIFEFSVRVTQLQCQCRNNTANRSLQTNNFCSNFMPRRCRVTQPLPGTGSLVRACDVNKLSTWALRFRARRHGSSHISAADMHRQVGLLESSGKTQPAGSLVPALEIPLASPSCAPAEPQKHVCDSLHS